MRHCVKGHCLRKRILCTYTLKHLAPTGIKFNTQKFLMLLYKLHWKKWNVSQEWVWRTIRKHISLKASTRVTIKFQTQPPVSSSAVDYLSDDVLVYITLLEDYAAYLRLGDTAWGVLRLYASEQATVLTCSSVCFKWA